MSQPTFTEVQLQSLYEFRNPVAVRAFVDDHPYLVPVLLEAYTAIQQYLPASRMVLDTFIDREEGVQSQLVLTVVMDVPVEEVTTRLVAFDEGWWLEKSRTTHDRLTITAG